MVPVTDRPCRDDAEPGRRFLRTARDVPYPDIQYHFWPYYIDGWSPPPDKDGYCFDVGPVQTASRGWVRLASADPLTAPVMRLNGLKEDIDRKVFRESIRITREIAAQSAFDRLRGPEVAPGPDATSDDDLDAFVRANATAPIMFAAPARWDVTMASWHRICGFTA